MRMFIYTPDRICATNQYSDATPGKYALDDVARELQAEIVKWECRYAGKVYPHHASDFMEWEYLSTGGGWYMDMDILFVKPIPQLDADAVFCFAADSSVFTIGFIGASMGNPIFQDILSSARMNYNPAYHEATGALAAYAATRTDWRTKSPAQDTLNYFKQKYPKLELATLPDSSIYPFRCETLFCNNAPLPSGMIGIHWFGGHPISQKWNSLLGEDNWENYDNSFTSAMREVRKL